MDEIECSHCEEMPCECDDWPSPWHWFVKEVEDTKRAAVRVVDAIERGDPRALREAAQLLFYSDDAWNYSFAELVRRKPLITRMVRRELINTWIWWGSSMRRYTWDDGLVADGMRLILGQYKGPDRRLYRGEWPNAGKVGIAWTKHRRVADMFAKWKKGVVLETIAPAQIILGSVPSWTSMKLGRHVRVDEYLVDPRLLTQVHLTANGATYIPRKTMSVASATAFSEI